MPGLGVTAWTQDDAIWILRQVVLGSDPLPPISEVIEDIDVRSIEFPSWLSGASAPNWRGIWYPAFWADWQLFRPNRPAGTAGGDGSAATHVTQVGGGRYSTFLTTADL